MKKVIVLIMLISAAVSLSAQPEPVPRMCAEWEPAVGTLIRWPLGIPYSLVIELAADDSLYVLVENQNDLNQAINNFTANQVNLSNCSFIFTDTYSHWTRDWGPVSIFTGEDHWAIVDPMFDGYPWVPGDRSDKSRGWEEDDAVNQEVADYFQTELYPLPAYLTGGNIMTDGYGTAFSTEQMYAENAEMMTENQFRQHAYDYCGIENYHLLSNTEDYGIQHIDCAAKLLDEERILVKSLPGWHPEYERLENLVTELSQLTSCFGRPYQIFRIFCASYDGNSVAAYTNSLILNNKVFVPLFDIASDTAALETYQNLMPGHTVIGIPYSLWYYYDALHCRARAIFDRFMLRMEHRPLDQEISSDEELRFDVKITDHSETGLISDQLWLKWRFAQSPDWLEASLAETDIPDVYSCTLAPFPAGTEIEYYLTAADNSGRVEKLPGTAPLSFYSFQISDVSSEGQTITPSFSFLGNHPNPFNPSGAGRSSSTTFSFLLTRPEIVSLNIYNLRGQLVTTLTDGYYSAGRHSVNWIPQNPASGIYLYRIQCGSIHIQGKSILLK